MADCSSPGRVVDNFVADANVLYPPAVARALEEKNSCKNTKNPLTRTLAVRKLAKLTLPRHLAQLEPQPLRAELLNGCLSASEDVPGGAALPSVGESLNPQDDCNAKLQVPLDQMPSQSQRLGIDTGNPQQPIKGPYSPVLQHRLLHPMLAAQPLPRSARATSSSKTEPHRSPKLRSPRKSEMLKGLWHEGSWVLVPPAALLAEGVYNAPVVPGVLPARHRRSRKQYPSQLPQGTHQLSGYLSQVDRVDRPSGIIEAVAEEDSDPDDHAADALAQHGATLSPSHEQASDVVQSAMSSAFDVVLPSVSRPLSDAAGESIASGCCDVAVNYDPNGAVRVVLGIE